MQKITINESPQGVQTCELDITVEEWISILKNEDITKPMYRHAIAAFCKESGHKSTCKDLSKKYYGNSSSGNSQKYNSWITQFGESVSEYLNRFEIIDKEGKQHYWLVAMEKGETTESNLFQWTLRQELATAISKLGWDKQCSWIPIYQEIANKLLTFKDDRKSLLDIIYSLDSQFVSYIKASKNGGQVSDIDPYTIYGIFNRALLFENRIEILSFFKQKFNLSSDLPTDFDGVPVVNIQKATFYFREYYDTDIQPLWDFFESSLQEDQTKLHELFDKVIMQHGIKWNITMGLFWTRPYKYISLDSRNRDYLPAIGINVFGENELSAHNYFELLQMVNNKIESRAIKEKDIPDISIQAYLKSNMSASTIWMVGYSFGRNNSQYDKFMEESIWQGNFSDSKTDQKQLAIAKSIKVGDILILKSTSTKGTKHNLPFLRVKAVGIVTNLMDTEQNSNGYTSFTCEVNYISQEETDFDGNTYGSYRDTIQELRKQHKAISDYVYSILGEDMVTSNKYQQYIDLLKSTKNLVLTGAPGTGKTFLAKSIAKAMDAEVMFVQFHPSYDYTDFVEGLRPIENDGGQIGFERKDGVFKEFCKYAARNLEDSKKSIQELTLEKSLRERYDKMIAAINDGSLTKIPLKTGTKHMEMVEVSKQNNIILKSPSPSATQTYTISFDRIEKLSLAFPDSESLNSISNIDKDVRNAIGGCNTSAYWAVLNELYKQEETQQEEVVSDIKRKDFVFIIDEINRGEASKIFGELFYAIDPGYRGESETLIKTQYQNLIPQTDTFANGFFVPENVYILATMNDIDRSVESMDFAMRRRFTWVEVTPEETQGMLDECLDKDNAKEAKATMSRLNSKIAKTEGLGSAYMVGPSYFLKLKDYKGSFEKLWEMNIYPLLKEYLRGYRKAETILNTFEKAYFNDGSDNEEEEV